MTTNKSPLEMVLEAFSEKNMQTMFLNYNMTIYKNHLRKLADETDEKINPLLPGIYQPILFHVDDKQVAGEPFNIEHIDKLVHRTNKNPSSYFMTNLSEAIKNTPKQFVCYMLIYPNELAIVVYYLCYVDDKDNNDKDDVFIIGFGLDSTSYIPMVHKLSNGNKCAHCKSKDKLLKCKACNQVQYCNTTCQKAHWKIHKPICKIIVGIMGGEF